MLNWSVEQITNKVIQTGKISKNEFLNLVQKKKQEFEGLVSDEGAAFIVANELGVKLIDTNKEFIKIKDIISGLKRINVAGQIIDVGNVRTFTGKKTGKVANITIADDTNKIRVVLWNNMTKLITNQEIKKGDTIIIKNAYTKQGINNEPEIHISSRTIIKINPEGIKIQPNPNIQTQPTNNTTNNETIYGVFTNFFQPHEFTACSQCHKKITTTCNEHPTSNKETRYVLTGFLSTNNKSVRTIMFTNTIKKTLNQENLTNQEIIEKISKKLLWKETELKGYYKNDDQYGESFVIKEINKAQPTQIAKKLLQQIKTTKKPLS